MKWIGGIAVLLASCGGGDATSAGSPEERGDPAVQSAAGSLSGDPAEIAWHVVDTDFSKGRLGHEQTVTFQDLIALHGHWCDGLVVGALGLGEALQQLYPNAPIDRTDLRILSRSSPCLTDAAILLTGGRAQFGTFQVSDTLTGLYIVQRISDGRAFRVKLNPGIKPAAIDSLTLLAIARTLSPCGLDSLQGIEEAFGQYLLTMDPKDAFTIIELSDFHWPDPTGPVYTKTDILNKNAPRCAH